ncbi:hypothetical protein D3A96_13245, partial [Robertkochia marina]
MFNNKNITMKSSYTALKQLRFPAFLTLALLVVSCGSFEAASYYGNDGIYSEDIVYYEDQNAPRPQKTEPQDTSSEVMTNFENYFSNTSQTLDRMITQMDEQDVFTDVDTYSSMDSTQVNDSSLVNINYDMDYQVGNPGWGDNPQGVDINIVNTGWGWGWGSPYWGGWVDPYWGWGWGGFGPG